MTYRVIVPITAITPEAWPGVNHVPAQAVTWVEPTRGVLIDFLSDEAPPANAVYVAEYSAGTYSEVLTPSPALAWAHHFSGWDPATWPGA